MKHWFQNIVEACDIDAYWKCFDDSTPIDKDPNTSYEKWYEPLEKRIAGVLKTSRVPKSAIDFFDDWCPNNTRHVNVERRYVNPNLIQSISGLLDGDYWRFDWRIELTIVGSIKADDLLGKVAIRKDWVLCWGIGRSLLPKVD